MKPEELAKITRDAPVGALVEGDLIRCECVENWEGRHLWYCNPLLVTESGHLFQLYKKGGEYICEPQSTYRFSAPCLREIVAVLEKLKEVAASNPVC